MDSDTHLPICSCDGIALQQSIFYRSWRWIHLYVVPAMNLLIYSEKPRAPILQPSILMLFSHYLSRQLERSVAREHSILLTTLDFPSSLRYLSLEQSISGPSKPTAGFSCVLDDILTVRTFWRRRNICWWMYCMSCGIVFRALSDYNPLCSTTTECKTRFRSFLLLQHRQPGSSCRCSVLIVVASVPRKV